MMSAFLEKMPKVELHLHLEGAIPLDAVWELVLKYGDLKNIGAPEKLEAKFRYRNFSHFIDTWIWLGNFLKAYEDYRFIAEKVAEDLIKQHIRYAELFYSPSRDSAKHLDSVKITEAVLSGFQRYDDKIRLRLIADIVRDNGTDEAFAMLGELKEMREMGVVGIGIGGSEHRYPPEPFGPVFAQARKWGFKTTAHAGEGAGTESIWGALKALRVDRIGHGVRAKEDPALLAYLKKNRTPLEMCPVSNLRTGVVARIEDHPIREYFDKDLVVTVSTDDPKMFNTSLVEEYRVLQSTFNFTTDMIKKVAENAIEAAWCTRTEKENLMAELDAYFALKA